MTNDERPKLLTRAVIQPRSLTLDERYRALVVDHLRHWNVAVDD